MEDSWWRGEGTYSHAEASKGGKMVGLRGWRIAGGGGRGHSLNHSLTVNNVQCTQEWIRMGG